MVANGMRKGIDIGLGRVGVERLARHIDDFVFDSVGQLGASRR